MCAGAPTNGFGTVINGHTGCMTRFTAKTTSAAVVPAARAPIWAALTDPVLLPKLTPLLQRIDADGDIWQWHMNSISALGVSIRPTFTERMSFIDGHRIEYTHEPPEGVTEWSGAEGWYELSEVEGGTQLGISLTLCIDVPLPKATGRAVRRIMKGTMDRTGDRFAKNLLDHLGLSDVAGAAA
jgi:Polyketide cyclase / dehydrase and lipid transport